MLSVLSRSARRTSDCTYALSALLGRQVTVRGFWPRRSGTGRFSISLVRMSANSQNTPIRSGTLMNRANRVFRR